MNKEKPLVFISYASQDKERVLPYFDSLDSGDYTLWMDCKRLVAGQDWDFEIRKNFDKSDIIITFISKNSFQKRGYIQREIKLALKKMEEKLHDDIYIIPIIFDDIDIPNELKEIHCISDSGERENIKNIKNSLEIQIGKLTDSEYEKNQDETVSWRLNTKKEARDGLPGYSVECQFIALHSKIYKNLDDVSSLINSDLVSHFLQYRTCLLEQNSSWFNYGMSSYQRTNTIESHCSSVNIVGRIISILYSNYFMGAQSAHGNMGYYSYNFILDFPIKIYTLQEIFKDPDRTLPLLQQYIRNDLASAIYEGELDDFSSEWLASGTENWEKLNNFIFNNDGLSILFSPYSVAAYAYGSQIVQIPYSLIYEEIKDIYISFLEIRRPM
jgi:hypothetical protein